MSDMNHIARTRSGPHYEYLHVDYTFVGQGITREIRTLFVNGMKQSKETSAIWGHTEDDVFVNLDREGWELVTYDFGIDAQSSLGRDRHHAKFRRELTKTNA